ncbi:MAG: hypothetical protein HOE45_05925 [Gammaproteobacteria bacterium]|mgnify:FL=1|nr:hypothetical protein [Gammaproteobacteria bacterium]MBT5826035.1 hypothetical protein [Gammaproteobacteria bacterium]MBT6419265.1 hypothetical protein [Gammaproteobacteria bacterium]MBT6577050.1 hypothetical protein [Gammaproteobacteria bacterium]
MFIVKFNISPTNKASLISSCAASAKGLKPGTYDLWLIASLKSDNNNKISIPLGQLTDAGEQQFHLRSQSNRSATQDLAVKHVVITADKQDPFKQTLLIGSPSLFQNVFYRDQYG